MPEAITSTLFKITAKDPEKLSKLAMYDVSKVADKGKDKELSLTKKSTPKTGKSWRLIYKEKSKECLMLFEAEGETVTACDLFCGTHDECLQEIKKLKLTADLVNSKTGDMK